MQANFRGEVQMREMHEFFKLADIDYDGKVSLEEYIKYASDLTGDSSDKKQEKQEM